jgi:hypothetical protein
MSLNFDKAGVSGHIVTRIDPLKGFMKRRPITGLPDQSSDEPLHRLQRSSSAQFSGVLPALYVAKPVTASESKRAG